MTDSSWHRKELPKYLQNMQANFVEQIPEVLWPLYEEGSEVGADCENPRFVVEYGYEITNGHGDPMDTSLGLDYLPEEAERPFFEVGQIVTLSGVDLLVLSVEASEGVAEATNRPVTWFDVRVDLPESHKENERG